MSEGKGYHNQTAKFLAVVGENMPSMSREVMQKWIDNPLLLQSALSFLANPPKEVFSVWKRIKLGTGLKTKEDFLSAFELGGYRVSNWAKNILSQPAFKAADKEIEIDLVIATIKDLGFQESTPRSRIYKRAQEIGLELCPAEVGPQLRIQYPDQTKGEWLLVAMEPITDSDGDLSVFEVKHGFGGRWLGGNGGDPDCVWSPGNRWVFCRK